MRATVSGPAFCGQDAAPDVATDDWVDEPVGDACRHHHAESSRARGVDAVAVVAAEGEHQLLSDALLSDGGHLVAVDDCLARLTAWETRHYVSDRCCNMWWNQRWDDIA